MKIDLERARRLGRSLWFVVALGLGVLLATGGAVGAQAQATDPSAHYAELAPPTPGERAGRLQHAPANLGALLPGRTRTVQSAVAPLRLATSATLAANSANAALAAVPSTPVLVAMPSSPTYDLSATFSFASTGATSYECRLDLASFAPCTSPQTYPGPLSFGIHLFRVRARNASGVSPTRSYLWMISRPPAPTITSSPPSSTLERTAAFAFASPLQGVTFECRLDSAAFTPCVSPKAYSGLPLGTRTFRVRARNASGVGLTTTFRWTITTLPAPTLVAMPASPTFERSASFAFTSPVAGVTFECRLDGAVFAPCSSPKAYSGPLALGPHTFRVRAVHPTSGTSPAAQHTWTIALAPPTITSGPSASTPETTASFAFTHPGPSVSFQCRLDSAAFTACSSPKTYSGVAVGAHTFDVRAVSGTTTSTSASQSWTVVAPQQANAVKMRLLVVSADGNETDLPAIQAFLRQLGVPFTTLIATQTELTPQFLANGNTGNFQGVILATGNLTHNAAAPGEPENWISAFSPEEWQTLWDYEAAFGVRQVTSFTFPFGLPDDYGLDLVTYQDTLATPLSATLTDAGKDVFSYLNTSSPVTFKGAWVYLATKRDPSVTPLLTTAGGYVIASTKSYPDGRENLAVTAANNPFLLHSQLLSYGLVNWVTRGVFLGERHVNIGVQIDDLFIDSDMWDIDANSDATGLRYRLDGGDFANVVNWQNGIRSRPNLAGFRMEWAFNGEGADPALWEDDDLTPTGDTLTPMVRALESNFSYVNHTLTHASLDSISYSDALTELTQNHGWALDLGFTRYDPDALVQPDISGLENPAFHQAAYDFGTRYLISDASRPEWANPTPNAGFWSQFQPEILIIPRRANNLFYSLRTPAEWVDEYNWFYWLGSPSSSPWKIWPDQKTFGQILDLESDNLLSYLVRWDIDPWMFHQANLGRYTGNRFLLADLLEATFDKYASVYNLPVRNLTQKQSGQLMARRMAYDASGVDATLVPCQSITLTVEHSATVPLTGVAAGTSESYGGQTISSLPVDAGTPKTIPVTC